MRGRRSVKTYSEKRLTQWKHKNCLKAKYEAASGVNMHLVDQERLRERERVDKMLREILAMPGKKTKEEDNETKVLPIPSAAAIHGTRRDEGSGHTGGVSSVAEGKEEERTGGEAQ